MEQKKITIISFDNWGYDKYISQTLNQMGHEARHIKTSHFKYKNRYQKAINFFSKLLFNKNLKEIYIQEWILQELSTKGVQDYILVIHPGSFQEKYHLKFKSFAKKYITYLYDSLARYPLDFELKEIFDSVYSFDLYDVRQHNFFSLTNYYYFDTEKPTQSVNDLVYIGSIDNRIEIVDKIGQLTSEFSKNYILYSIGAKSWMYLFKQKILTKYANLIFSKKHFNHQQMLDLYRSSKVILDVIRPHQEGLSFRIFEAMGLSKKIITNNQAILDYDFYHPNNILVIDNEITASKIKEFISTDYQYREIVENYHISNWCKKVFNLD
jgi:hypothetical protein